MDNFATLATIDGKLQTHVQSIIHQTWKKRNVPSSSELIIGGSTVEGAMTSRYFYPMKIKDERNKEIEFDVNVLLGKIPVEMKDLVEDVSDKPGRVYLTYNEELCKLIESKHDCEKFMSEQKGDYVNSFVAKESMVGVFVLRDMESSMKELISSATDKDRSCIEIKEIMGEITKASTASDIQIFINGEMKTSISMDIAVMFRIDWWPEIAAKWINKKRNWPCKKVIDEMIKECYVICKPSDEEKDNQTSYELTYSFHAIEAKLAKLRSPKQKLIYSIFKSLIYCCIKVINADVIPSFLGKTIMLKVTEMYPPDHDLWNDEYKALTYLLNYFLMAVKADTLQYFFIPEINLISSSLVAIKQDVINALQELLDNLPARIASMPVREAIVFYSEMVDVCANVYKQMVNDPDKSPESKTFFETKRPSNHWSVGSNVQNFTGRQDDVSNVHKLLTRNERVVVCGHGGLGKTELSIYYCHQYHEHYDSVIWLNAKTEYSLKADISRLAKDLNISIVDATGKNLQADVIMKRIYVHFENRKVLFAFDDVKDENVLSCFLPPVVTANHQRLRILITTQFNDWSKIFGKYQIQVFSEQVAYKFVKRNIDKLLFDEEIVRDLVKQMDYLPLALQLFVAYINKHHITVDEFSKDFKERFQRIRTRNFNPWYGKTVNVVFNMVLRSIKEDSVLHLLRAMAFLDCNKIEWNVLEIFRGQINNLNLEDAASTLTNCSLIRRKNDDSGVFYTMHSLIAETIKDGLGEVEVTYYGCLSARTITITQNAKGGLVLEQGFLRHTITLVKTFDKNWSVLKELQHMKRLLHKGFFKEGNFSLALEVLQILLNNEEIHDLFSSLYTKYLIGQGQCALGNYSYALDNTSIVYKVLVKIFGRFHYFPIQVKYYICICTLSLHEDSNETLRLHNELYEEMKHTPGGFHEEKFHVRLTIGSIFRNRGEEKEAMKVFNELYEEFRSSPKSYQSPIILNDIGDCMIQLGKFEDAINLYNFLYDFMKSTYGEKHLLTAMYRVPIATCLFLMKEYCKALEIFEEIYEVYKHMLGDGHVLTKDTKTYICNCLICLGRFDAVHLYK